MTPYRKPSPPDAPPSFLNRMWKPILIGGMVGVVSMRGCAYLIDSSNLWRENERREIREFWEDARAECRRGGRNWHETPTDPNDTIANTLFTGECWDR